MEWMFPLWVRFWDQCSLLLQYEILEELVTFLMKKIIELFVLCEHVALVWHFKNTITFDSLVSGKKSIPDHRSSSLDPRKMSAPSYTPSPTSDDVPSYMRSTSASTKKERQTAPQALTSQQRRRSSVGLAQSTSDLRSVAKDVEEDTRYYFFRGKYFWSWQVSYGKPEYPVTLMCVRTRHKIVIKLNEWIIFTE